MNLAIILICGGLASAIVTIFVLVTLLDWAEATRGERMAMGAIAGGLVWAAPDRLHAGGVGLGDLIFLAGVLALIVVTYTRRILRHVDQLDGKADGRAGPIGVGWGAPPDDRAG
ncbi:MAG: hypothetical protein AB1760_19090 [Pseudomonadota bacterium]